MSSIKTTVPNFVARIPFMKQSAIRRSKLFLRN